MDVHVHVTVLHLHGEHLTRLRTEVSAHLGTLEQTLSEGTTLTSAENGGFLKDMAFLQRRLCTEGEMFCKRLHVLLAEAKTGHDSGEKISQRTSS
jgi:hypothetical protein